MQPCPPQAGEGPPTHRTDEALIASALAGDHPALTELVERHHAPLLGYLYRMVGGDHALAEDLVQETFMRVIRRGSYRPGGPFKPWLYAIATNLVRDHAKSAATRHSARSGQTPDVLDVADPASGPEAEAIAAEQGAEVAWALGQLSPEYRAALLLRFYGGMSLAEIAGALDVPLGTVKSRLSVGCRRLRDMLADSYREAI